MNKAFTANINDQVTARGYLDENDQLVMLEPEGAFDTIQLKISGSAVDYQGLFPVIEQHLMVARNQLNTETTYEAVTYQGKCGIVLNKKSESMTVAATNATVSERDNNTFAILATGDCVITIEE